MSHNTATGQGSAFNVGNAELVSFTNVTFEENSGATLDACANHLVVPRHRMYDTATVDQLRPSIIQLINGTGTKGSGYCASIITIANSTWARNNAQLGGAIYAAEGCRLAVTNTTFRENHAQVRESAR